jgi:hypothetical protein
LTGDVGRGCGDASRALLFCFEIARQFHFGGLPTILLPIHQPPSGFLILSELFTKFWQGHLSR